MMLSARYPHPPEGETRICLKSRLAANSTLSHAKGHVSYAGGFGDEVASTVASPHDRAARDHDRTVESGARGAVGAAALGR